MTIAWARRFVTLVANLVGEGVEEEDIEAGFEQFLLDAGMPIEFNDTAELDEFQKYFAEEYLPALADEEDRDSVLDCADRKEEAESEAYDDVYKKMRALAAGRGYDLEDGEIESIIEEAEEDGDSVLDCADGALRELVEDWVADHQE